MYEKRELENIVGSERVLDDPAVLEGYSKDMSFVHSIKPRYVIKPLNAEQIQNIVKWANENLTPLVPVSSGNPHFRGDTVPSTGGSVIVDMSDMKRILRIDAKNRVAMIEPGVTFGELVPALEKEGLRANMPLLARSSKSVLGSLLEREPVIMPKYQWDMADPLACMEIVFGTGDMFRTGSAAGPGTLEEQWKAGGAQIEPSGPTSASFYRFIQGAQGTMGIVTWASARCERLPKIVEPFFVGSEKPDNLFEFVHWLIRLGLTDECFILNATNLATIVSKGSVEDYERVVKESPIWILFFCIAGYKYFPEERIAFQRRDMGEIAQRLGLEARKDLAGVSASKILQLTKLPSEDPYWKQRRRGSCYDIFFLTTYDQIPDFINVMKNTADEFGFSSEDIGIYLQPAAKGTSCHCEFSLFFNSANKKESKVVNELSVDVVRKLLRKGAFFSRPYGSWAEMVYSGDAETTSVIRRIKNIFDPNGVLNPGKLCC